MAASKNIVTPYDDAAKTMLAKLTPLIIPVVNIMFGRDYSADAAVNLFFTELLGKKGGVISRHLDSHFEIAENGEAAMYHLEVESAPDASIMIRFWEYDSLSASYNRNAADKWQLDVTMPNAGLIALRPLPGNPAELTIVLHGDEGDARHKVKVLYMKDYSARKLIEKKLTFLTPFLLFCYDKQMQAAKNDEGSKTELLGRLHDELNVLAEYFVQLEEDGKLSSDDVALLAELVKYVSDSLAEQLPEVKAEVDEMMGGRILEMPYERFKRRAQTAEEQRAKAEEQAARAKEQRAKAEEQAAAVQERLIRNMIEMAGELGRDDSYIVSRLQQDAELTLDQARAALIGHDAGAALP